MTSTPDEEGVLRSTPAMAQEIEQYEKMVREAVSAGQMLTAIEVARDGLVRYPDSLALRQQLALGLVQTGAIEAAQTVLSELLQESAKDEETLSLLGRIHKELWRRSADPEAATAALRKASQYYAEAYALKESYYPGINLAFTLAAGGDRAGARAIAAKVEKACRSELAYSGDKAGGWLLGTLAEALVHLGDSAEAAKFYRRAGEVFHGRWRDLASMQRQAREIAGFLKETETGITSWSDIKAIQRRARAFFYKPRKLDRDWLDACFEFPSVVVFAGHMIDAPGRPAPRFPASREAAVREEIRRHLDKVRAGVGYSSAACGADILFCECLLERGAKVNLVLPSPVDAFRKQSVSFAGPAWEKRFIDVLTNASSVLFANASEGVASDIDPATPQALVYSNRIVMGLAVLQARTLDLDLNALTVWDGRPGDASGGTSTNVAQWREQGIEPFVISPLGEPAAPAPAPAAPAASPAAAGAADIRQEIKAVVHAEMLHYRRVREAQMPAFIREFNGILSRVAASAGARPAMSSSWGGSHQFVFDDLRTGALFGVGLRDGIAATKWESLGLPREIGVKVALHAGPVWVHPDPFQGHPSFIGAHAARTTRMVPVTPPGQVYASQEFAALCGAAGVTEVGFEFLGRVATTKLFEDAPLYRLDRVG